MTVLCRHSVVTSLSGRGKLGGVGGKAESTGNACECLAFPLLSRVVRAGTRAGGSHLGAVLAEKTLEVCGAKGTNTNVPTAFYFILTSAL